MIAMLFGVAATSAIGSVHCVAMCGPLVGLQGARSVRLAAIHSLGRLATYLAIGAFAGLAGSALDLAGRLGSVQRLATIVAGLTIVAWGVLALTGRAPRLKSSAFSRALVQIRTRRPARHMLLLGLITGLLPCGWLWAFAIAAAGTASPLIGALVMLAFWCGTAPAMIGVVGLAGPMILRLRARIPVITSVALIGLGLATLGMRWRDAGVVQITAPHCHCGAR